MLFVYNDLETKLYTPSYSETDAFTERNNRVYLRIFLHYNPCSVDNMTMRLDVSILLIALMLLYFNRNSLLKRYA